MMLGDFYFWQRLLRDYMVLFSITIGKILHVLLLLFIRRILHDDFVKIFIYIFMHSAKKKVLWSTTETSKCRIHLVLLIREAKEGNEKMKMEGPIKQVFNLLELSFAMVEGVDCNWLLHEKKDAQLIDGIKIMHGGQFSTALSSTICPMQSNTSFRGGYLSRKVHFSSRSLLGEMCWCWSKKREREEILPRGGSHPTLVAGQFSGEDIAVDPC